MVFVGCYRHAPNVDAVEYLCRDVLPRLKPALLRKHPVFIVGDGLDDTVRALGKNLPDVRMVGWTPSVAGGARFLAGQARAGDRVVTIGAGDVNAAVEVILETLA